MLIYAGLSVNGTSKPTFFACAQAAILQLYQSDTIKTKNWADLKIQFIEEE